MSYTTSTAWSRPVSSPCYTKHGQRRDAVLSGRITTVTMSKSDQLGRCCTVELNYSDMSVRLAVVSVTRERALETCETSCVTRAAKPFFIPVVHSPLGAMGYVAAPELSSRGGRAQIHGTRDSARTHLGREAMSGAEEYVAAPKLNSAMRRGPGQCGSIGAHLDRKAGSETEEHVTTPELNSARRRDPEPRDT
jgi:hypothetical protein